MKFPNPSMYGVLFVTLFLISPLSRQNLGSLFGIRDPLLIRHATSASCCLQEADFALDITDAANLSIWQMLFSLETLTSVLFLLNGVWFFI